MTRPAEAVALARSMGLHPLKCSPMEGERTAFNGVLIENGCLLMVQASSTKSPAIADGVVGLTYSKISGWVLHAA